jgi:hypothetical protein
MRKNAATLAVLAVLLTGSIPALRLSGRAQQSSSSTGAIRGIITDGSGGVLPGATVVARASDGRVLATTVADAAGAYVMRDLPAGPISLLFELEGFADASVSVVLNAGEELRAAQRLDLAPLSETVVVSAADADPARPRFASSPAPPPLVARPLPEHDRAAVCGPAKPDPQPESLGTVKSRRYETQGELYLAGAELVIDGGLEDGLLVGRNLVARRYYHVRGATGAIVLAEHSAGVIQIVTATEHASVAVVVYTCDAIRKGDFLASFKPEPVRTPDPSGTPAYDDAARILFADDGQWLGVPERMMVIDRGTAQGIRAGQRVTLFRQSRGLLRRSPAGEGVVVAVRSDSATIRVERVVDAFAAGDWAAPQLSTRASGDGR